MVSCMSRYLLGKRKITLSGRSLKMTIPKSLVERLGLEAGDEVEIVFDASKNVVIVRLPNKEVKKDEK